MIGVLATTDENFSDSSGAPFPGRPFVFSDVRLLFLGPLARRVSRLQQWRVRLVHWPISKKRPAQTRSEEHTSELQSLAYLVCRLLLEKKIYKTQRSLLSSRWYPVIELVCSLVPSN